jgi:hypothetical protein
VDLNDTAKLYQLFGGQAGDYQELRRSEQAKSAKQRWPLLAWLDLSALHVSDAPKVQVGESSSPAAARTAPAMAAPTMATPLSTAFQAPAQAHHVSTPKPAWMPLVKPAPVQAPTAQPVMPVAAPPTPATLHRASLPAQQPLSQPAQQPASQPAATFTQQIKKSAAAPYLQQLLGNPARLQALGGAPAQPVAPVTANTSVNVSATAAPQAIAPTQQGLQDIFSRLAQPAASSTPAAEPTGSLWSNLTSRL